MSGCGEIAGAGPGVHPCAANSRTRSATPTALRSQATILAPAVPERQRHGVADLPRPAHAGHQDDFPAEIERGALMRTSDSRE